VTNTKTVIVLDRASWHRGKALKKYLEGKGVGLLFLPSSSSALSPIETVWGVWKVKWRKYLATLNHEELVTANLRTLVRNHLSNFAQSFDPTNVYTLCFQQMNKVMQGEKL
jgi:transposase